MFLKGFDAKICNTLYVDKNLRYHGLIQACSRSNRGLGQKKSQGNIAWLRNMKPKVGEAIALFSNKDADETILIAPYQEHVDRFNEAVMELMKIAPTPVSVDKLIFEDNMLVFVCALRELIRIENVLTSFAAFANAPLPIGCGWRADRMAPCIVSHDYLVASANRPQQSSPNPPSNADSKTVRRKTRIQPQVSLSHKSADFTAAKMHTP